MTTAAHSDAAVQSKQRRRGNQLAATGAGAPGSAVRVQIVAAFVPPNAGEASAPLPEVVGGSASLAVSAHGGPIAYRLSLYDAAGARTQLAAGLLPANGTVEVPLGSTWPGPHSVRLEWASLEGGSLVGAITVRDDMGKIVQTLAVHPAPSG